MYLVFGFLIIGIKILAVTTGRYAEQVHSDHQCLKGIDVKGAICQSPRLMVLVSGSKFFRQL